LTGRTGSFEAAWKSYRPFVVSGCAFLLLIQIAYFSMAYPGAIRGRADFSTLYTAGLMVRSGRAADLFDYNANTQFQERIIGPSHGPVPFNHLAYETALFIPLSLLPYRTAYHIFLLVNLGLLLFSFQALRRFTSHIKCVWAWLPATIFICFLPVGVALFQGQDSIVLLWLLTCSYLAMEKNQEYRAGLFLGLTLFKFQFCIPIALLLLAWNRRRAVLSFAATAAAAIGASFALTGLRTLSIYSSYLFSVSTRLGSGEQVKYAIYPLAMPNIFGLLFAIAGNHTVITVVISCIVITWAARRPPSFPLAVAVAMLVSYHGLIHDATILIIPILLFAEAGFRNGPTSWRRVWPSVATVVYPTIAVAATLPFCLLAVPVFGFLEGDETSRPPYSPCDQVKSP
jgi:Glycosyltransferase family 87